MNTLETLIYEVSKFFLTPVLIILCLMFAYALFALGSMLVEHAVRTLRRHRVTALASFARAHPEAGQIELELQLAKLIEPPRLVSRVAPMLGLVATMIPMGPALVAVSSGNAQGIARNLVIAFSAVIVALLAASMTYWVLTVRRRWLLADLNDILVARAAGLHIVAPERQAAHG